MGTLRETLENDLKTTLEGDFGLPCPITYANGSRQTKSKNDATKDLMAQVIYETPEVNLDTGDTKLVPITAVTYRRTSLDQIPALGERVKIEIPQTPTTSASTVTMIATEDNHQRHGRSIGIITFYMAEAKQSA